MRFWPKQNQSSGTFPLHVATVRAGESSLSTILARHGLATDWSQPRLRGRDRSITRRGRLTSAVAATPLPLRLAVARGA